MTKQSIAAWIASAGLIGRGRVDEKMDHMATDTDTLVTMANTINNVPTTVESASSPDLELPEQFMVFMDIFNHPDSAYRPTTVIGEELEQYLATFAQKWQAGNADDLDAGLQQVTQQTQDALEQAQI